MGKFLSEKSSLSKPAVIRKKREKYLKKASYSKNSTESDCCSRKQRRRSSFGADMGQRWARQDVDEGVKLYHLQKHEEALTKWRNALRRLRSPEDKFITMGYIVQAHCEAGAYRDMLVYSLHQIDLANDQEDSYMRAEAYLNLARANERLSEFHKAVSYGRHSLQNHSLDPRTPGYAYLCVGSAYLGFSNFQMSLENFEMAMQIANSTQDRLLELQICVGLGSLFTQIRDLDKAIVFLKNALSLLKSVSIEDVHAKYKSLILYHLSAALRRKGAYQDAKGAAEEALRLAVENGNRPVQARCLHSLGDIHREFKEEERTWSRYESAYKLMQDISDKMGQIFVLSSMAKAAVTLRSSKSSTCECQAIQLNKKCLEVAKSVGCKLAMLKSHSRLLNLYCHLNDEESEEIARKAVTTLTQEMELFCNFCGQRYGTKDESLQALPCSHIYHERCLRDYLSIRDKKQCPKCQHKTSSLKLLRHTTPNAVAPPALGGCEPSTSNQIQSHRHMTPPLSHHTTPPPREHVTPERRHRYAKRSEHNPHLIPISLASSPGIDLMPSCSHSCTVTDV